MIYKVVDLFGNETLKVLDSPAIKKKNLFTEYDVFVEKFEIKKTTDDCYTPKEVYEAVLDYVKNNYDLSDKEILRPFYPDADYKEINYNKNSVVIDNPPFSIISKICRFYLSKDIPFFLFAPHLTNFGWTETGLTHIIVSYNIVYENGASIPTSFLSNMFNGVKVIGSAELHQKIKFAVESGKKPNRRKMIKYKHPQEVITAAMIGGLVEKGVNIKILDSSCKHIRNILGLRKIGKKLFGSGFLLSEKAAAEKAAAEKAAAEKATAEKAIILELSKEERAIIEALE